MRQNLFLNPLFLQRMVKMIWPNSIRILQ
jgi:hypothetical protein